MQLRPRWVVAILLWSMAQWPTDGFARPLTGGYMMVAHDGLLYLRLTQVGHDLTGYIQVVQASDRLPAGYTLALQDISGTVTGGTLMLKIGGLFGYGSGEWDGTRSGERLALVYASQTGRLERLDLAPITVTRWNRALSGFIERRDHVMIQQARRRALAEGESLIENDLSLAQDILTEAQSAADLARHDLAADIEQDQQAQAAVTRDQGHLASVQKAVADAKAQVKPADRQGNEDAANAGIIDDRRVSQARNELRLAENHLRLIRQQETVDRSGVLAKQRAIARASARIAQDKALLHPPSGKLPAPHFARPNVLAIGIVNHNGAQISRRTGSSSVQILLECDLGQQLEIAGQIEGWYCVLLGDGTLGCIPIEEVSLVGASRQPADGSHRKAALQRLGDAPHRLGSHRLKRN